MKSIFKYALNGLRCTVQLPRGAVVLSTGVQRDSGSTAVQTAVQRSGLCIWALVEVDLDAPLEPVDFAVYLTGDIVPEHTITDGKFIGTAQGTGIVFHVFQRVS